MRTSVLLGLTAVLLAACSANNNGTHTDSGTPDGMLHRGDARADASGDGGGEAAADVADDVALDSGSTDAGLGDVTGDDAVAAADVIDVIAPQDVAMDTGPDDAGSTDAGSTDAGTDTGVDVGIDTGSFTDVVDVPAMDVCVPRTEVCNGLDDDCNGQTDESGCPGHLLISEIVPTPNRAEFVEIYNPTSAPIALDHVFLTDTSVYPRIFASMGAPTVPSSDFVAQFPPGAVILPDEYQTIATGNPSTWGAYYTNNPCPTYYLQATAMIGACTTSRPMQPVPGVPGSIDASATLTNGGEPVTLFLWDGASDTVVDLDYVYYGTPSTDGFNAPVDKSMLFVDGPDPDSNGTGYRLDTPANLQDHAPLPEFSGAAIRCDFSEGTEVLNGGNGIWGHNETSENLSVTWITTPPLVPGDAAFTNAVDATPNGANTCSVR